MEATISAIRRNAYVDLALSTFLLAACGYAWLAHGRPVWLVVVATLAMVSQIAESTYCLRWSRDPQIRARHGFGWIHAFRATIALVFCALFAFLSLPLLVLWLLAAAYGFWLPALRWVQWRRGPSG